METLKKRVHLGRNISRIRELRDMKQDALAFAIGTSQQTVSIMENSEWIDDDKLEQVAAALKVTPETIKNFSDEAVLNFFNTFNDLDFSNSHDAQVGSNQGPYNNCTFNPLDKLMESHDENKQLYERLIQAEKDKVSYLEKLLNK